MLRLDRVTRIEAVRALAGSGLSQALDNGALDQGESSSILLCMGVYIHSPPKKN